MSAPTPTAAGLAATLIAAGQLTDPRWIEAFRAVPRHVFVPWFQRDDNTTVDGTNPDDRDEWLAGVYSDTPLTTQTKPVPETDLQWPTSSSTRPSLMARMLHLLDVTDGQRVLEIGTGSGYNAALLCHRLGDANVASVDIHPELIEQARDRLATLGYRPHLRAGDGAGGVPERAPYHRIIATCAVAAIPSAWIDQLTVGGVVVADIRGELASSLAVLRKIDGDTVEGRFLAAPGHFMWLRAAAENPLRFAGTLRSRVQRDNAERTTSSIDPTILDSPDLRFLLQQLCAVAQIWITSREGRQITQIHTVDGFWAEVETTPDGGYAVTQDGSHPLWTTIEKVVELWERLGRPTRDRFGLTADREGSHQLWLDAPRQRVSLGTAMPGRN